MIVASPLPSFRSKTRWQTIIFSLKLHPPLPSKNPTYERSRFGNTLEQSTFMQTRSPASSGSALPPTAMDSSLESTTCRIVQHGGKRYEALKEGSAYILRPQSEGSMCKAHKSTNKGAEQQQSVFYNPIQQFNRDLSVLAIKAYGEHLLNLRKQKVEKKRRNAPESTGPRERKRKRKDEGPTAAGGELPSKATESDIDKRPDAGGPGLNLIESTAAASETKGPGSHISGQKGPTFKILDALSATGLRALRYAKEISFVTHVVSNDLSPSAIESIKLNIEYNGVETLVQPNNGDARAYMYSLLGPQRPSGNGVYFGKFDVIDLDPYGTAAPFIDATVQAVNDGGLLCVTCTDAGVFASTGHPDKAFALYGGVPVKGSLSHEGGLRLILNGMAIAAAKYGHAIEPLLSLSIDFYARLFVRVHKSPMEVKFLSGNTMLVYNCDAGCGAWTTQRLTYTKHKVGKTGEPIYHYGLAQSPVTMPNCEHCGMKTHLGGPMWAGPLHNPHFIQKILNMLPQMDRNTYQTMDRIEGMLTTALEEDLLLDTSSKGGTPEMLLAAGDDPMQSCPIIPRTDPAQRDPHPFFFSLSAIAKVLHTQTVPLDVFRGALYHLGYRSTRSHTKPNSIRTDAPWNVIWEIMREWARQKSPIKEGALSSNSPGAAIMRKSREPTSEKRGQDDQWLHLLRNEITAAMESGRDVLDLTTKIEAALYRSGTRLTQGTNMSRLQPKDVEDTVDMSEADIEVGINTNNLEQQVQETEEKEKQTENGLPTGEAHSTATTIATGTHTLNVVFDGELGKRASTAFSKKRMVRYQSNPRANWGPMSRASGGT